MDLMSEKSFICVSEKNPEGFQQGRKGCQSQRLILGKFLGAVGLLKNTILREHGPDLLEELSLFLGDGF